MKILYFGGQKSGKSQLAEQKALSLSNQTKSKPYYIATYDSSFGDSEMTNRIDLHQSQREDKFITIEEPKDISKVIEPNQTYLVDCLTMLILNNNDLENLKSQLETISMIDTNIVFVLNDINSGVIPSDKFSREFVDMSGIIGQMIAKMCDEVYEVKLGLELKLK